MLEKTYDYMRNQRARFAHQVEYVKETAIDDTIDERIERAESMYKTETIEELEEAVGMLNKLDIDDETIQESAEIDRLLNAEDNVTFNEMIGIQ